VEIVISYDEKGCLPQHISWWWFLQRYRVKFFFIWM